MFIFVRFSISYIFIFSSFLHSLFAQDSLLLSEEALGQKPIYTNLGQAFKHYDKVFRLALKGTGGYYGKVDAVSPDIDSLVNLQYFYVVNEALTSLPASFGQLQKLQQLYLSGNQFKSIPDTIFSLKNLKRLDLRANQLVAISDKIGQLTQLEYLYLQDNPALDFLPSDAIAKLQKLKVLNTKNTKISREQIQYIQKLLPQTKIEY
jgi:Leucine-rich repeat (LRR) protein